MYYMSVMNVVGGNGVTEVQKLLILSSCFKSVTVAHLLLACFEHPVCYYCKTLFLTQKKLPTMHFKEIKSH